MGQVEKDEKTEPHINNKENQHKIGPQNQHPEYLVEQPKGMIVGSGDQRRIPSVVIVDKKSTGKTGILSKHHDNQLSVESTSSVDQPKDTIKGKVSPGSGRLLPYVPKRYVVPRVPAGITSPSASSSSATTAKRIVKEVSFEDDDLDDGTDINGPERRLDTFDETDEYVTDVSGRENNQDTNGDVSDVSAVIGDGVSIPLPAILRDYIGPAPTTASDVPRKRGDVLSPAPQDDIQRQLMADLDMGPLNKEFDPLTSSLKDIGQERNLTTSGVSNSVKNVDLLSKQDGALDCWGAHFPAIFSTNDKAYQMNSDTRRTTSEMSTTLDTYGTYQRGPGRGNNRSRITNTYKKMRNYMGDSEVDDDDGSTLYQRQRNHRDLQSMLDDKKLENGSSVTNGDQYTNQSFYEDDFLTESEKQRLSYLRLIGTSAKGINGSSSFNRRTSDSLIDTSYHHSNVYTNGRGMLTPNFEGTRLNEDPMNALKNVLQTPSFTGIGGLSSTEVENSQYNGDREVQHMLPMEDSNRLDDCNRYSSILGNDAALSSNGALNPFDERKFFRNNNLRQFINMQC